MNNTSEYVIADIDLLREAAKQLRADGHGQFSAVVVDAEAELRRVREERNAAVETILLIAAGELSPTTLQARARAFIQANLDKAAARRNAAELN
ncbi:MAG TPA: hypothetical protein VGG92_13400 [Caulobacteraceae bacterium]|jgi:dephospho-CoA kinase